ncbi:protein FAM200C-like [Parasteatoda tepidariorum]|uniref:protein FAM200C-like n=1 Tax=Parasteatoda tepidariorum TaxID=114398 RepID=UPI001C720613|nr:general transcription factor II-I repeat domain-containing protein 2-like [Parasteatoda tepidariorum]
MAFKRKLSRFFELLDSVTEFLDTTDPVLSESLKQRKLETAYLTHSFEKMKEINVKLQGNKMNIIKAKGIISSFIAKFDIYKSNIGRKELMQFPTLKKCSMADIEILENKILIFTDQLDQLQDLMKLEIPD